MAPAPRTGVNRTALVIGGIVAAAVLVAGLVVVLGRGGDDRVATSNRTPTTTPAAAGSGGTSTTAAGSGGGAGGGSPEDLFASAADGTSPIDGTSARKVINAWFDVWKVGQVQHDATTLAKVETGAALQWDSVACATGCQVAFGKVRSTSFSARPHQAYPATFLGQVIVDVASTDPADSGPPETTTFLVVFTRASAADPWLAKLVTSYVGTPAIQPPSGLAGVIEDPPTVTGPVDPHTLPDRVIEFWESYRDTGKPPAGSPFHDNGMLHERSVQLQKAHQQMEAAADDRTTYRSGAAEDGLDEFASGGRNLVTCSTVRWTSVDTPKVPGGTFTVTGGSTSLWPAVVPPGTYQRVERDGVRQVCFWQSPDCRCLALSGLDGGAYVARTTP